MRILFLLILFQQIFTSNMIPQETEKRFRARELGIVVGILPTGKYNAITDVKGVKVGHKTIIMGDSIRTGVTVIIPHEGDIFKDKVPCAFYAGNAFGKFAGSTQIEELGELETPIALTNTLAVPKVADALIQYTLEKSGGEIRSVNPVVGETNDGHLNKIQDRVITYQDVLDAINSASSGEVEEGSVGAGTGTIAFGWKGGIGTASRVLPKNLGGWTVGVLVQTNFGGILTINGAPVGLELGKYYLKDELEKADGSIIIVVATDAPLMPHQLKRLAKRAMLGLARTGSPSTNGSGDYVIAFSTNPNCRVKSTDDYRPQTIEVLPNPALSPLFQAVVEATEEAIYNSLLKAKTMTGYKGRKVEAIPIDKVMEILKKYNVLNYDKKFKLR
ncbi:L-aminopeptidase DmpA. Serine peptidase. MEROPS family S58 [Candidatus Kryptonium thompsonii]|uniref:L-aminopeptidase DmpA. Serine peptidase. MEROPS family S58 n=3 Tax=Candidatus Kryptonium thompsonii TaxID=1633631 RepID=A0A0N7MZJ9_9BACT|nr:L-aminopeptidase DmpA. Serine peptidase. MEROPS family S58 [Candidatus Kryptonium thompsoni]CUS83755.1 L-aminopeptidase DmpA. Serine peptidase. MEROPS family S58 [Candidatus Kryptonium thompsoni]CUS84077.1 L-aminopeptidase DmpA. Serine peptidase. MEROPS family S58 [Candidatus Kryptonium thompsoni]CUS85287.1 L-aminopeptidase DmpA. Serine peptidase. MEROPS family S58 [Candidatus Kryptonium thompsoni]CUS87713.1 L-aminopeptidase DmpA. Serine peptidase. MEROPS family S58 [Candidatus Kryptonium th